MKFNEEEFITYIESKEPTLEKENLESKWYLVQTQSNCESKARKNIASKIVLFNLTDKVEQIIFPSYEEMVAKVGGGKRKKINKIYGNYLFILCEMDAHVYTAIKSADKVNQFIYSGAAGAGGLPKPISENEVKTLIDKMKAFKTGEIKTSKFSVGDTVRIKNSTFKDTVGIISKIKDDKIVVNVTLFGRETPIDLNLKDIEMETN